MLRPELECAPVGADDAGVTSCLRCRGSCREGFSHWCRAPNGARIDRDRNGSQAELRHPAWAPVSAPGPALGFGLSRALSSAQAVLQFGLRPSCLSRNLLHSATGQKPDRLPPPATGDRAQRGSAHRDRRVPPPASRIRAPRARGKAHQRRSVPAYL
jgi:hypothetical protein